MNSSMAASEELKETLDKEREDFKTRAINISLWQHKILVLKEQIERLEKKLMRQRLCKLLGSMQLNMH